MKSHSEHLASSIQRHGSYQDGLTTEPSAWGSSAASDKARDAITAQPWEHVVLQETQDHEVHLEKQAAMDEADEIDDTDGMAISFIDEEDGELASRGRSRSRTDRG